MKKIFYLFFALFLTVMVIGLLPVHSEAELYENVLRLHVIANSDSDEDQALKLKVRDRILAEVETLVADCESFEDAETVLSKEENLALLTAAAENAVRAEGFDYPISISLGEERYPKKSYESLCFPSGVYTSLQVKIGESGGQNWWCVLFPQLCLSAASKSENEDKFISAGFTPEQYKIVTDNDEGQYEVRFKILEIIQNIGK